MTAKRFLTEDDKTSLEKDVAAANTAASSAASVAKSASTTAQEAIELARAGTNIRTFTTLNQIGMSSGDFSSSDFKANVVKLADYFKGKNFLFNMFIEKGNPASWYNSIYSKLSNDLSVTLGAADNLQVFIRGMMSDSTDTGVILIDVVSDGYASNGVVFSCSFTRSLLGDDVSKFIYTQHAPRKFSVNLASETEAVYNGSSDVSMGVSGMLSLSHGGTGGNTAESARRNLGITPDNIGAVPTTRKVNNKELSSDISLSAEDVGALSIIGGTLTGVTLALKNGFARLIAGSKQIQMTAHEVENNFDNVTTLLLSQAQTLDKALRLTRRINANETYYNIFGEHNVTSGTTDIGEGSAMTSLIHIVYED